MKIQEWINDQLVADEMRWKGAFQYQCQFIRDELTHLVGSGLHYKQVKDITEVISTHRSKSIELPVCKLNRPDLGLELIMRNNFYNWKLSVISRDPIVSDFSGLMHVTPPIDPKYTGNPLASVYFEGFPQEYIFGYYNENNRNFSAEIYGNQNLYTVIFLIMRSLNAIKPMIWHTPESHKKALDEEYGS